jgi:hypothetical protein
MAFTVKSWQPSTNNSNSFNNNNNNNNNNNKKERERERDYILRGFSSSEAFKIPKYPAADNFGNITTGML